MSIINPRQTDLRHFFRSGPLPCPYLPGRVERKLFTRLTGPDPEGLNSGLSQAGFRRSHDIVYRPVCSGCRACVPVRIPVAGFRPSRGMRRTMTGNRDLTLIERPARRSIEHYRLFLNYQRSRHGESDMAQMRQSDYAAMIEEGHAGTSVFDLRGADGRLLGAILTDRLADGFSAVYSFYDPDEARRGLGTFLILALVDQARREGRGYIYLGYWIKDSPKMAYKARFRPLEALVDGNWRPVDETFGAPAGPPDPSGSDCF
ncbi:MAG: arginyltransferase [Inquilinaceae bacterium]